jgi:hypothetical protein
VLAKTLAVIGGVRGEGRTGTTYMVKGGRKKRRGKLIEWKKIPKLGLK